MLSIPEIASQLVNGTLTDTGNDTNRTLLLVGSKSVGKSTVLNSFLDKSDVPRETLVLEYSFGRKSNQKQGLEKTVCHVWEFGGKLDILKNVLPSIPVKGKFYYCLMVDISKIKNIWNTLEICIQAMKEIYVGSDEPELIILCGKYDLFKNYDSEIKKFITITLRSVALLHNAHVLLYSSKEQQLVRRAKELFYGIGFGNGVPFKERNANFNKPMVIPKDSDCWEHIGIVKCSLEQVKSRHINRIASAIDIAPEVATYAPERSHPEPVLDSLVTLKYEELRNTESLDISVNDYLSRIRT